MSIFRLSIVVFISFFFLAPFSEANMKKGQLGDQKERTFSFSTNSDGPCSAVVIYDAVSSDLDIFLLTDNEDVLAAGLSQQNNFDSCEASLPPGDFLVAVSSFEGASPFRVVVNCANQETISTLASSQASELKEVELDAKGKKALQKLRVMSERLKRRSN